MAKTAGKSSRPLRLLLLSLVAMIAAFILLVRFTYDVPAADEELTLDAVYRAADGGRIVSAKLLDEDARMIGRICDGRAVAGTTASAPRRCTGEVTTFRISYPRSDVATQTLIERTAARAPLSIDKQVPKAVSKMVITYIFPLAMLANLFGIIFVSKSGESSISDIVGFGRIGRKKNRKKRGAPEVSFADVAGAEEAITELREVTEYLSEPERFQAYGAAAPKGVLLFGPPGCGKTLLARAVAGESGVAFFSISGADFVESLVGVGAARVRDLFAQVREVAPAIVFIDEIDAVGRRREGEGMTGGEREQTVNQLLVEMDGFEVSAGIVVMGATNRPDILDPALLRPGRFDRHVTVTPPEMAGRRAILELHARGKPLAPDVDFELLARRTPGFTGADLANVVNEGALLAIREGEGMAVRADHLSEAVLRVLHGPQRRGRIMTAEERKRLAFHEAGHAVVTTALGRGSESHRISIVARGRGLGQSMSGSDSERVLFTTEDMSAQVAIAFGGLAAEELAFGSTSTTAEDDLRKATALARQMAGLYGMAPELGRMSVLSAAEGYLGGEHALDVVSGQTMAAFDEAVKALLQRGERAAVKILSRYSDELQRVAVALEEQETLEGHTLESLLSSVRPEVAMFADDDEAPPGNGGSRARRGERAGVR